MKEPLKIKKVIVGSEVAPPHINIDFTSQRLIRDTDCATLLGCSKATWWRRVSDGTMPPAIKIGGISRWKLLDVLQVIEQLRAVQLLEDHPITSLRK
jgi:predicted DNA-binding transcriptional regulator AlpA